MTRDEARELIAAKLGFRTDLNTTIDLELQLVQSETLETDHEFKPWFLFTDYQDATFITSVGVDYVSLPENFLLQIEDAFLYFQEPEATGNIVDGNTIGIQQAPSGATGGVVAYNICLNSTYLGIQADTDTTFRCFDNILVNCVNGIGLAGSEDGNAFWLCTTNKIARGGSPTYGSRTVTTDPLFVDPAKPWLGLKPGSPCQSAGAYIQGARDRFGRRYSNPPNIGPWAVLEKD